MYSSFIDVFFRKKSSVTPENSAKKKKIARLSNTIFSSKSIGKESRISIETMNVKTEHGDGIRNPISISKKPTADTDVDYDDHIVVPNESEDNDESDVLSTMQDEDANPRESVSEKNGMKIDNFFGSNDSLSSEYISRISKNKYMNDNRKARGGETQSGDNSPALVNSSYFSSEYNIRDNFFHDYVKIQLKNKIPLSYMELNTVDMFSHKKKNEIIRLYNDCLKDFT
jgi:hypothetical protein